MRRLWIVCANDVWGPFWNLNVHRFLFVRRNQEMCSAHNKRNFYTCTPGRLIIIITYYFYPWFTSFHVLQYQVSVVFNYQGRLKISASNLHRAGLGRLNREPCGQMPALFLKPLRLRRPQMCWLWANKFTANNAPCAFGRPLLNAALTFNQVGAFERDFISGLLGESVPIAVLTFFLEGKAWSSLYVEKIGAGKWN